MPRHALSAFFERLVVAAMPLAAAACGRGGVAAEDMAIADNQVDLHATAPDGDHGSCEMNHPQVSVALPAGTLAPDGGTDCFVPSVCGAYCPPTYTICCGPTPTSGGWELLICAYNCGPAGRRPPGLRAAPTRGGCALGDHFAQMAHLEAASVHAFRQLARELAAHDAPLYLVQSARRAAGDEIRHARLTARIARAHGCTPAPVALNRAHQPRSLIEIAVDNAAEGCVRETFGALLATFQARAATQPLIAQTMAEIARDETRHAELAWAIHDWTARQLDRAARRRVSRARHAAAASLEAEVAEPPASLAAAAGLPNVAQAHRFLAAANRELWA